MYCITAAPLLFSRVTVVMFVRSSTSSTFSSKRIVSFSGFSSFTRRLTPLLPSALQLSFSRKFSRVSPTNRRRL